MNALRFLNVWAKWGLIPRLMAADPQAMPAVEPRVPVVFQRLTDEQARDYLRKAKIYFDQVLMGGPRTAGKLVIKVR